MRQLFTESQESALRAVPHPFPYQGSKRLLAPTIVALLPADTSLLIEPFAGSAAVSIAARHGGRVEGVVLGDLNRPLMALWQAIVDDPEAVADRYEVLWHVQLDDPRGYYDVVRRRFNATGEPAMLLYLLNRCVKAAVRYSGTGDFNQSADHRRLGAKPAVVRDRLVSTSLTMRGARAIAGSYETLLLEASRPDVVYLDPPYQGVSGVSDRRYLAGLSREMFESALGSAVDRGVSFIVSYDAVATDRAYGLPLSPGLGLTHRHVVSGRSAQATLHGRDTVTTESLYVSPALMNRLDSARSSSMSLLDKAEDAMQSQFQ